jgi:hypothetical protein
MNNRTPDFKDRRKPENRLRRISKENDKEQEGIVQKWLDISDKLFKNDQDNDRTPQAA